MASTQDMQQATGTAAIGPLSSHMTHSNPGYAQQQQHSHLTHSAAAARQDTRPDPLPPHLQPIAPPPGRGGPSATALTARPSGIPEHLQPRPFSHQRAPSPRGRQQHDQGEAAQQHHKQLPLPPLQQMPHYQSQGSATVLQQSGPNPESVGPTGPMRGAPPTGPEPSYQAQVPYVAGGGSVAAPAAAPTLDHLSDASAMSGWYQGGGPALQQQQQHTYGADFQPAQVYTSAPTASQHLPRLQIHQQNMQRPQVQQQQQQQAQLQQVQQQEQAQQQQQMQYPAMQQHVAPSEQYQQHSYQQHARPAVTDDDSVGQVAPGQQTSGHAPLRTPQGPVLHSALSGATQSRALEAKQYPPPPVQLAPTAAEVAATPVSFVQLVPQTAGIQVDQSGAVRVVVPPASQDADTGTGAGAALGQQALPQHSAAAMYGAVPPRQPQPQHQPEPQLHRYGSMGAPPAPVQPLSQHTAKEVAQQATNHGYDMPPGYQRPASGGSVAAAPEVNGGPSAMWDEAAGNHREADVYAPYGSHMGGSGGDGRNYLPAVERSRQQSASQPLHVEQDSGYMYADPSARSRFPGTGCGGSGGSGLEIHGCRTPAPDLDGMATDGYGATITSARMVGVERLGSQGDGSYVEGPPPKPSAGSGARAPHGMPELPLYEELPLAEAIRRGEALVTTFMATRADGDLLQGMQQTLLLTCESRIYDLMRALRTAAADAEAARVAAVDAATEVAKAEAEAAAAEAAAAEAEVDIDLGDMRAGNYAFVVDRSIRTVWPLETPEHSLYRTVAEQLLLEEGGRTVPVNNEEVRLKPHEMVGATLCNLPAVQQVVADIRAAGGSSTMTLLRQEAGLFDIKEHVHKQTPTSLQWLVRLRVDKLPSFSELRHVLRAVVDTVLPAATPLPSSSAAALSKGGKPEVRLPLSQQQRQNGGRLSSASPLKGRSSCSGGTGRDMVDAGGSGSAGAAAASPGLQFLGTEPEGEEERLVMRHVALHLLACKGNELGLFQDKIECAAEKLPPALARLYGMGRLHALKQLLKSHPFFWVAQKSVYSSDVLAGTTHECVSLHSNNMLEFQYRARLALQQELQELQQSKRRKTGTATAVAGGGGDAEGADHSGTLEKWWLDLRAKRPNVRVGEP